MKPTQIALGTGLALLAAGCGPQTPAAPPTAPSPTPPAPTAPPPAAPDMSKSPDPTAGGPLYTQHCQGCHGDRGPGVPKAGIALAEAGHEEEGELRATILNGKGKMPAFKGRLTDAQIAALIPYLRTLPAAQSGEGEEHEKEEKGEHGEKGD